MEFIDLAAQQAVIRPQLETALSRVLDHGQYIMGPEVAELESRLAEFVGVKHAITCSSGTDALLLPLMAHGVGSGDAIFTTPFSFFATAEVIALVGATPVFVDIDPVTFNMDPDLLAPAIERVRAEGALTPKGIIPVDLFGLPADYDRIQAVADSHGLFVIQDAAQSFGAVYKGKRAPGNVHCGATSFFPAKPLGCYGDGGAVFTDDDAFADVLRSLIVHGKGSDKYNNIRIGLNARLDTMQAAVLIEKLRIYPGEVEARQRIADRYARLLEGTPGVSTPSVPDAHQSVWAQYTLTCSDRDGLRERLNEAGIPSLVYYVKPLHLLDALAHLGGKKGEHLHAETASEHVLSIPFHPYLSDADQNRVVAVIRGDR